MKTDKHLQFWQEECQIEAFKKCCGSYQDSWKKWGRTLIKNAGYQSVLDVGAGVYSEYFGFKADNIEIKYTATEITDNFIAIGLEKNINVFKCKAQEMPFDNNSFDVVICYDVINHQEDFKETILELTRVARNEVLISFFKPFLEEKECILELNNCTGRFKMQNIKDVGVILHRIKNVLGETTCIYNFFSYNSITEFLKSKYLNYEWHKITQENGHNKRILKIIK